MDTTVQPEPGKGNPFAYFTQEMVEEALDEDVQRMVRQYDPEKEIVVTLLKAQERVSSYRVQVMPPQTGGYQSTHR